MKLVARWLQILARIDLVTKLLLGSIAAIIISVVVVQAWTLHVVDMTVRATAESQLDADLGLLRNAMAQRSTAWHVGPDGALMAGDRPAEGLDELTDRVGEATRGVATVFIGDTRAATNIREPNGTRAVGSKLAHSPAWDAVIGRGESFRGEVAILGVPHITLYEPFRDASGKQIGILFVGTPTAQTLAIVRKVRNQAFIAGFVTILLVGAVRWWLLRHSVRPLTQVADTVQRIADGQLDVLGLQSHDQLGEIGRAVERLRISAQHTRALEVTAAAENAERARRVEQMDAITATLERQVGGVAARLSTASQALETSAGSIGGTASRIQERAASMAISADEASTSVQTVAAAAEQLTASIYEISQQVALSAQTSGKAVEDARRTDVIVRALSEAAQHIGNVVGLISRIAGQTNLLALNATIEAARAGEAGKGFAVVASEVKSLAAQTAQATAAISAQVAQIQAATSNAVAAIQGVTTSIETVSKIAMSIASAVEQQGAATAEIARSVAQTAASTRSVSVEISELSRNAQASGLEVENVRGGADGVARQAIELSTEVEAFVAKLKAA